MIKADKRWSDIKFWRSLGIMKDRLTAGYYWNAIDRTYDLEAKVIKQPEERRIPRPRERHSTPGLAHVCGKKDDPTG